MSSKLQLDVRHLNRWWRHLVNAYEVRQAWCLLQAMQGAIQVLGFTLVVVSLYHGGVDLMGLKLNTLDLSSFSALTLLVGSFDR